MANLDGAARQLEKFKKEIQSKQHECALATLSDLKIKVTEFPSKPPLGRESPTREGELLIARDMLEHSVLLAVNMKDDKLFERNFEQLRPYYSDLRALLPQSQQEATIMGLNLIKLLTQSRIAEFHLELETLPSVAQASPQIAFPKLLEQQLMEGAYARLNSELQDAPSPYMAFFCSQLAHTVRDEMASCAASAYKKLSLSDAAGMLGFKTRHELLQYCREQKWKHDEQYIQFQQVETREVEEGSFDVFHNMINYVHELDRII